MFKVKMDNIVIDVIEDPVWVSYQQKNDLFLRTTEQYATGVVSSDGSMIFHLEGSPKYDENQSTVKLEKITKEEAAEIEGVLKKQETIEELPEEEIYSPVPLAELRAMVYGLSEKVDILEQKIRAKEDVNIK